MNVYILFIGLLILQQVETVKYRFQPPNISLAPGQPIFSENPQQIRRRFRNEAQLQEYPITYCLKYNFNSHKCQQCFQGFILKDDNYIVDLLFKPKKVNTELSFILNHSPNIQSDQRNTIMLNRNPFCSEITSNGAFCLSCHPGFVLIDGNCIQNQDQFTLAQQLYLRPFQAPKNTFCRSFDEQGTCISCFPQAQFENNITNQCIIRTQFGLDCRLHQVCVPKSIQCLTYSSQGFCKSCSKQAININGICRINKPQSLCLQIGNDSKCAKCSQYGQLKNGICRYKTPHCLQYNPDGTCNVCKVTYRRMNGQCIRPSKIMFANIDPYCATWKEGECIQCKFGFGFNQGYCRNIQQIKSSGNIPDLDPIHNQQIF